MSKYSKGKQFIYLSILFSLLLILRFVTNLEICFFLVFNFAATISYITALKFFLISKRNKKKFDYLYVGLCTLGAILLLANWVVIIMGAN
ncbi:MAG: hypothetical protein HRT71_21720 [Flavobacteriales bacterium]|nr:hypothetical protein [Flavobacteriales bacterium]